MNPLKFDGEPQNWDRFWKSWKAYLKTSDIGDVATDEQKAKNFASSVTAGLAEEMFSWLENGDRTFEEWISRLRVRYGSPEEQFRKEWSNMHVHTKEKVDQQD